MFRYPTKECLGLTEKPAEGLLLEQLSKMQASHLGKPRMKKQVDKWTMTGTMGLYKGAVVIVTEWNGP